jgi:predicted RNA-binding protein with PUA-like domain
VYSWNGLMMEGRTAWTGVRNPQAANNLKAMKPGDRVFFYHSNQGLAIVGIAEVVKAYYPDPGDKTGKYGAVDLKPVQPLKVPVTLAAIKAEPKLADLGLVRQSRLSVMPVDEKSWKLICDLGGVKG